MAITRHRLGGAWPGYVAAALALASAAVSLYWTLGGTWLLDTVGGVFEDLARKRSGGAVALGGLVVAVKLLGGALALALARRWGARLGRRWLLLGGFGGSAVLVVYGGALVLAGGLVLGGVLSPSQPVDRHALRWHVFLWDLWFLLWGVALGLAAWRFRATTRRAGGQAAR